MHPLGLANMGAVCLWESQKLSGNKEVIEEKFWKRGSTTRMLIQWSLPLS